MAIQLLGADGSTIAVIDPTAKAQRVSIRPPEILAWNSIGAQSGGLTGAGAGAPVFSFRNLSSKLILVKRVGVGFILTTAFTTAQIVDFGLMMARSFTASDSGGTAISLTGSNGKHRTSLATPTSVDARISSTAALTAGTRTLDANTIGQVGALASALGAGIMPATNNLFSHDTGDHPLVLAINEGFVISNLTAMGANGVGRLYVNFEMAEADAY